MTEGARLATGHDRPQLRRDAARNQQRVLEAALTAVRRDGQNVPLATIATEAGVGVATLYRRYPSREALLQALEIRAYQVVIGTLEGVLKANLSGLASIEAFLERTVNTRDQLFLPWHGAPAIADPEAARLRRVIRERVAALLRKGRADRTIATGVTPISVIIFGAMLAQSLANVDNWDDLAREQIRIFLRGIAALPS